MSKIEKSGIRLAVLLMALIPAMRADDMAYMINAQSQFGVIDLSTGNFTPVGSSNLASSMAAGLGVTGGKLYTAAVNGNTLYQVNPATGALTAVGNGSIQYYGFGSTTSGLYAVATYTGTNNVPLFNLYS